MSATNQCVIEEFLIHSDRRKEGEKPFDLAPFVVSIDYFEDIFSPCITLKVLILNESQVVAEDEEDAESTDDKLKALYQGLPCLLYTSPSPRDRISSRMPSSA